MHQAYAPNRHTNFPFALSLGLFSFVGGCNEGPANFGDFVIVEQAEQEDKGVEQTRDKEGFQDESVQSISENAPTPSSETVAKPSDIVLRRITVNQGVSVSLVENGQWLSEQYRDAPIVAGREALIQAHWLRQPQFTPRRLAGRLRLRYKDGSEIEFSEELLVDGPSQEGSMSRAFSWQLDSTQLQPDSQFSIELIEVTDPSDELDVFGGKSGTASQRTGTAAITRFPEIGFKGIPSIDEPMGIKLVVMPLGGDCGEPQPFGPSEKTDFTNLIYNTYPLSRIDIEFREPETRLCESGSSNGVSLNSLAMIRHAEALGPEVMYIAVLSQSQSNGGGAGYVCDPLDPNCERVSWFGALGPANFGNAPHQIGHSLGLPHTFDNDEYEPNWGANLGNRLTWGFGLREGKHPGGFDMQGKFFPPDNYFDLLSFTEPWGNQWVSAYTYRSLASNITAMSNWSGLSASPGLSASKQALPHGQTPATATVVHGMFQRDGSLRWSTRQGYPHNAPYGDNSRFDSEATVELKLNEGAQPVVLSAIPKRQSDGRLAGFRFVLPNTQSAGDFKNATLTHHGQRYEITLPE